MMLHQRTWLRLPDYNFTTSRLLGTIILATNCILAASCILVVSGPNGWSGNSSLAAEVSGNQPPASGYEQIVGRLHEAIHLEVAAKDLPAFSIALLDGQRTVWAAGFGFQDAERKIPATGDTIYRVGSVSKLFTDIAVMQLVEQKQLDLDAPVTDYLPEFQPRNPHDKSITLRQLMSHRSGLVREPPVGHYFDPDEPTLQATVASLNRTTLVYQPESRTKYSNAGIAVVGAVLEEQQAKSFVQCIDQTILQPLEMHQSGFERSAANQSKLATAWMWTYDGRRFEAPTFPLGTAPAGNLYASVADLAKFLVAVFQEGRAPQGKILAPETLRQMISPQIGADGKRTDFGIGFHIGRLDGHKKIGHGGAVYGFSTQLEALPERKLGVAAVASLDGSNGVVGRLTDYALRLMLAKQDGKPLPAYPSTTPVPIERSGELVGEYRNGTRVARIWRQNDRIVLQRGTFQHELRLG